MGAKSSKTTPNQIDQKRPSFVKPFEDPVETPAPKGAWNNEALQTEPEKVSHESRPVDHESKIREILEGKIERRKTNELEHLPMSIVGKVENMVLDLSSSEDSDDNNGNGARKKSRKKRGKGGKKTKKSANPFGKISLVKIPIPNKEHLEQIQDAYALEFKEKKENKEMNGNKDASSNSIVNTPSKKNFLENWRSSRFGSSRLASQRTSSSGSKDARLSSRSILVPTTKVCVKIFVNVAATLTLFIIESTRM